MNTLIVGLFCMAAVQANIEYNFTEIGKACQSKLNTNDAALKKLITPEGIIPEDNELAQKYGECCFDDFISDAHEIINNEKLQQYVVGILTSAFKGDKKLAETAVGDVLGQCKNVKGPSKGVVAVKFANCLMQAHRQYKQ